MRCFSFSDAIDYPGPMITPVRLLNATKTAAAVRSLCCPTTTSKLRFFLGLRNIYYQFVPNISRVAAPLNKRLKKCEPTQFKINDKERRTLSNLKQNLILPSILALPRADGQFVTTSDVCDKQMFCDLQPEQEDGKFRMVGYWRGTLNDAEKNYDFNQRECLAVKLAVLLLRLYVKGKRFIVKTDHPALKRIHRLT